MSQRKRHHHDDDTGGHLHLGEGPPKRLEGVEQRVVAVRPTSCTKCGGTSLYEDHQRYGCRLCGMDWWKVAR